MFPSSTSNFQSIISLGELEESNSIVGSVALDPIKQHYVVGYTIKTHHSLHKSKRKKYNLITVKKEFPRLEINAKLPVSKHFASPSECPFYGTIETEDSTYTAADSASKHYRELTSKERIN